MRLGWLFLLSLPLLLHLGCASGAPAGTRASLERARYQPHVPPPAPPGRERVLEVARQLVGARSIVLSGRRYRDDCTSLPRAAYEAAGVDLFSAAQRGDNGVTAIYRFAQRQGRVYRGGWPVPGDLVFFRETYDLNRDGRHNDGLTHVGLVDAVSDDATITIIHRVRRGVVRYRMNLDHPDWRTNPETGEPINDYLRSTGIEKQPQLTGQLFAAYATVLDGAEPVASR
ncbi:MAG TPA: CHAP domain-containing protein [Myxococcales bacterium]|nr:CHAP domain-containing protein [Myxococcales bacterium]